MTRVLLLPAAAATCCLKGWTQFCMTLIDYVAYFDNIKVHKLANHMRNLNRNATLVNFMIGKNNHVTSM